jgi:hypothetical protein
MALVVPDRLVRAVEPRQHVGEIVVGVGAMRLDPDHALVALGGFGIELERLEHRSEIVVGVAVVRIDRDRLLVLRNRLLVAAERLQHGAEIEISAGQVGLELQRPTDRRHALLVVAALEQRKPQQVERDRVVRRLPDELLVGSNRLGQLAALVQLDRPCQIVAFGGGHAGTPTLNRSSISCRRGRRVRPATDRRIRRAASCRTTARRG